MGSLVPLSIIRWRYFNYRLFNSKKCAKNLLFSVVCLVSNVLCEPPLHIATHSLLPRIVFHSVTHFWVFIVYFYRAVVVGRFYRLVDFLARYSKETLNEWGRKRRRIKKPLKIKTEMSGKETKERRRRFRRRRRRMGKRKENWSNESSSFSEELRYPTEGKISISLGGRWGGGGVGGRKGGRKGVFTHLHCLCREADSALLLVTWSTAKDVCGKYGPSYSP